MLIAVVILSVIGILLAVASLIPSLGENKVLLAAGVIMVGVAVLLVGLGK
jgi:hypothetical protein